MMTRLLLWITASQGILCLACAFIFWDKLWVSQLGGVGSGYRFLILALWVILSGILSVVGWAGTEDYLHYKRKEGEKGK